MTQRPTVFLFGGAEKGRLCHPIYIHSLEHLFDSFGMPSNHSEGIPYAIRSLLYAHPLFYFRVEEEGFSYSNYHQGFKMLKENKLHPKISAVCMPGIGNCEIFKAVLPICQLNRIILITSEKDLYDYLTEK